MKKTFFLSLLAAPILNAGVFNPETIPADAQWYLHGDLENLRQTTTGKLIIKEIRKNEARKLAEAENLFGFDLITDLTDATLFGDGKDDRGAIILQGDIGRGHLEGIIVDADEYNTSLHGGTTIHIWEDKGKTQYAAFHKQNLVIISEQKDLVELAVDVLAKKKPSLKIAPGIPVENPVIFGVANIKGIDLPDDDGSKIIRKAESMIASLKEEGDNLRADLVVHTSSEKVAKQIKAVMNGVVAMGLLAEEKIEELDIQHEIEVEDTKMKMHMTVSIAKALALLSELD